MSMVRWGIVLLALLVVFGIHDAASQPSIADSCTWDQHQPTCHAAHAPPITAPPSTTADTAATDTSSNAGTTSASQPHPAASFCPAARSGLAEVTLLPISVRQHASALAMQLQSKAHLVVRAVEHVLLKGVAVLLAQAGRWHTRVGIDHRTRQTLMLRWHHQQQRQWQQRHSAKRHRQLAAGPSTASGKGHGGSADGLHPPGGRQNIEGQHSTQAASTQPSSQLSRPQLLVPAVMPLGGMCGSDTCTAHVRDLGLVEILQLLASDPGVMMAVATVAALLYCWERATRRRLARALRLVRQDLAEAAGAAKAAKRRSAAELELVRALAEQQVQVQRAEAAKNLQQVQATAAHSVAEAEARAADALRRLGEAERLAAQVLGNHTAGHDRALEQARRDQEAEVQLLTSSHAEAMQTQRYHMQLQRKALRRVMSGFGTFKEQVLEHVSESRLQVRALHEGLQPIASCIAALREGRHTAAERERRVRRAHAAQLEAVQAAADVRLEQLRVASQQLAEQQQREMAALTARVGSLRAALRLHRAVTERAFQEVGSSLKVRLQTFFELATSQAWAHQRREEELEGQLSAALERGWQLKGHIKRLRRALEQRDDEVADHIRDLEELGQRLNMANATLAAKEQQIRHDRELRDRLQTGLQEADMRERELEQQVSAAEEDARQAREAALRIPDLELQAAEIPKYCEKLQTAAMRIKQLSERMQAGQQQLEELRGELAARDAAVAEARHEAQAVEALAAQREQQMQTSMELQVKRAQAEVEAKAKELRHRQADIDLLKDELAKSKLEVVALRKPRPALPSEPRALQQLSSNTQSTGGSFKR